MDQPIQILVVEDDDDINRLLCSIIRKSRYHPQPAYSGTEAMLYLDHRKWDMILLDLMLPGMAGEDILAKISTDGTTPVIIISAKDSKATKIETLRAGADDFIAKPFDVDEVSARIDSVLRRTRNAHGAQQQKVLTHKDIHIDLETKSVHVSGTELSLTAREYTILVLLMKSPKKIFSKPNLFESVWDEPYHGDDNTINVHMSNLRNKISKASLKEEEHIETIWGMGYRMKS